VATLFPPHPPRFTPPSLDAGDLARLEACFDDLALRPIEGPDALRRWLEDESELLARIAGEQARRYVRMTRHTDDAAARAGYLAMEQQVMPRVKLRANELDRKFLASPALAALTDVGHRVVERRRRTQAELFRPENTELQRQEAELQTQQQELMGGITVTLDGETLTLQQLGPWLERQDRDARERAFRAGLDARRAHWPRLEEIFDRLVALRTEIARNAGFTTFTPFRYLDLGRYDYDEQTCRTLHDAIAEHVVPAVRELDRRRARALGVPRLRPWDLEVDPAGRPPLRPFTTEPELVALCRRLIAGVDPTFATWLDELQQRGLLDLMSRKGKAPGGYQYQLEDERVPFVFANGVGVHHDVQTLLHECGHAFHSLLCRDHALLQHRDYPIEIAETASMAMELMGLEHVGAIYAPEDARRVRRKHLEGVLRTLAWIASIDAFQHWVYGAPGHDHAQRRVAWLDIRRRFGGDVDWAGLDDALAMQWIAQPHLFHHPFYYIEYAIAQLAALQVWQRYRGDPAGALAAYRRALALGGSRPLPELFAALDVRFRLDADGLRPLVADVLAQLGE
jgi:oligoendopeptidase F